jgi:hypothetical protein
MCLCPTGGSASSHSIPLTSDPLLLCLSQCPIYIRLLQAHHGVEIFICDTNDYVASSSGWRRIFRLEEGEVTGSIVSGKLGLWHVRFDRIVLIQTCSQICFVTTKCLSTIVTQPRDMERFSLWSKLVLVKQLELLHLLFWNKSADVLIFNTLKNFSGVQLFRQEPHHLTGHSFLRQRMALGNFLSCRPKIVSFHINCGLWPNK